VNTVRVVTGTGRGPTETAAYDAALLAAGVGNHNLVSVSSVVPADATVTVLDRAPDLGAVGDRLTVVQARAVGTGAAAALSWARTDGGEGLFYEGTAVAEPPAPDAHTPDLRDRAERTAERGLTAGLDARGWTPAERATVTAAETVPTATDGSVPSDTATATEESGVGLAAAVALAVYGEGRSPF
jgi:arginine decarboxylase